MGSLLLLTGCPDEPAESDAGVAVEAPRDAGTEIVVAARPAWVDVPSTNADRTLSATGSVKGIKNPALRRATADNRARAELARRYERFVATMNAELGDATFDPKAFMASVVTGVQIVDHWQDDGSNVMYARAELDFSPFFAALEDEKQRAAAEKAWAQVSDD